MHHVVTLYGASLNKKILVRPRGFQLYSLKVQKGNMTMEANIKLIQDFDVGNISEKLPHRAVNF